MNRLNGFVASMFIAALSFPSYAAPGDAAAMEEMMPQAQLVVGANPVASEQAATTEVVVPAEAVAAANVPSKEEIAKLPETEIPVFTGAKQAKKAEGGGLSRILVTLGIITTVVGVVFFALKKWAARSSTNSKNPKIKVLTQHALGPKKNLAIISVAGESILIGITDHNISMLKTLSLIDDEVPETVPNHFENTLSDFEDDGEMGSFAADHDDFTVKGINEIRDKVSSRLNSMKRL